MSVKKSACATKPKASAAATPSQEWRDVLARMNDLGDAMTRWTRVAAHEDDAEEKLEQIRVGISEMALKADAAFGEVAGSGFGQQVRANAEQPARRSVKRRGVYARQPRRT